jgi:hypothetical protein
LIKRIRIKIRNQNIEDQTLNIIKYKIEGQSWKEKSNLQKNNKKRIPISNELNDDEWNF